MKPYSRNKNKFIILIIIIFIVCLSVIVWFNPITVFSPIKPTTINTTVSKDGVDNKIATNNTITKQTKPITLTFDKTKYSTTDPSSIWVVVNKQHPLVPISYAPIDTATTVGATISGIAVANFNAMNAAALAEGVNFTVVSSYRSYDTQNYIYNNYVATYGQALTDTFSARPGYSEHQTGFTVDLGSSTGIECNLDDCFGATAEGQWLAIHAYEYGFLLRYPSDKISITGYKSEPWHFRYIGRDLANEMKKNLITTLEEFFNISGGETYI